MTSSFTGPGLNNTVGDTAASVAQMRSDFEAMAASIRQMNSGLTTTGMMTGGGGGGGGGGGWNVIGGGTVKTADWGRVAESIAGGGPMAGLKTAATEIIKSTVKTAADVALLSYQDLRVGREEAMEMERMRLVARTGTGDFTRFQDNLNISMNDINVQDRWAVTKDLANAMSSYYGQAMGGGIGGEQRTAMAVGAMHTLGAIAGIEASAVGTGMGAMYSSQSYYKAMAAGIQTRNPVTGDMLNPEEIVNQYRKRLGANTPEQIKRALGPGGTLRAELMQTWGDAGLVEMISKGLVMSSELGAPLTVGDIQTAAMKAGGTQAYAGKEWTQGRDTESYKQGAMQNRVAEYTNDVTAGIATSNTILADINAKIANLEGPLRGIVAATETFGGIMDTAMKDMQGTTSYIWESAKEAIGNIFSAITNPSLASPFQLFSGVQGLATLGIGGFLARFLTAGAASSEPKPSGEYPTGEGGIGDPNEYLALIGEAPTTGEGGAAAIEPVSLSDEKVVERLKEVFGSTTTTNNVVINVAVQRASDAEAIQFAYKVKDLLTEDDELAAAGDGTF